MLNSLWVKYCLFCSLVWLDNEKGRGERVNMSMLHVCNGFWIVFSYVFFWRDILFPQLNSLDGSSEIGMISKQWTGLAREMFTDAENFGVKCKDRTDWDIFLWKVHAMKYQENKNISVIHPGLPRQITVKWLVSEITLHGISPRQKFCKVHIRMRVNLVS